MEEHSSSGEKGVTKEEESENTTNDIPPSDLSQSGTFEGEEKEENGKQEEEGDEGGEGEEEEEFTYREPILDGRNITFETRILNQFMVCSLCMGYYREASTIVECLHTFCKSCICVYLQNRSECPTCGVSLGTFPIEKVKFDRQLQNLFDKIFPDVIEKDAQIEKSYYKKKGIDYQPLNTLPKRPAEESDDQVAKKIKKSEALKKFYADEVSFELLLDETEKSLKKLDKPFIRTSAKVTVKHLKKYIQKKLPLDLNFDQIEITYRGEVLGSEHSLEYILKTRGMDFSSKTPLFKYRLRKAELL